MIYKKKKNTKIFVMPMLVLAFTIFFVLAFDLTLKNIEENNTWQNNATFDYIITNEVLKDESGNEIKDENGNVQYQQIYNISSASQLAGAFINSASAVGHTNISQNIGTIYRVVNNLDMSDKTWESQSVNAGETFDGGGFILDFGGKSNEGFINGNKGTVKNVFIDNINISSSKSYVGGVIHQNTGTVQNCHTLSGFVQSSNYNSSSNTASVGGIIGKSTAGQIINCTNNAEIKYGQYTGGVVGYTASTAVTNCKNYGKVQADYGISNAHYAGGIAGYCESGSINTSLNAAGVAASYTVGQESYAGGIAGFNQGAITNSGNTGSITAGYTKSSAAYAGGIAGRSDGEIKTCYNKGYTYSSAAYEQQESETIRDNQGYLVASGHYTVNSKRYYLEVYFFVGISVVKYNSKSFSGGIAGYSLNTEDAYDTKVTNCYSIGYSVAINSELRYEYSINIRYRVAEDKLLRDFYLQSDQVIFYKDNFTVSNMIGYGGGSNNYAYVNTNIDNMNIKKRIYCRETYIYSNYSKIELFNSSYGFLDGSIHYYTYYTIENNAFIFRYNLKPYKIILNYNIMQSYYRYIYLFSTSSSDKTNSFTTVSSPDSLKSNYYLSNLNTGLSSDENWSQAAGINNGYPYPSAMYW